MVQSGPSAWQNWTYTVSVSRNGSVVRAYSNITMTQMEVTDLTSSQRYTLSVRAESPRGQSTSVLFEGTTLQNGELVERQSHMLMYLWESTGSFSVLTWCIKLNVFFLDISFIDVSLG